MRPETEVVALCRSGEAETTAFERLLLESVANGSVESGGDIENLLRSTLLSHQVLHVPIALSTGEGPLPQP